MRDKQKLKAKRLAGQIPLIIIVVLELFIVTTSSVSSLSLTIQTDRPYYYVGDQILVFGTLKYGADPLQNWLVSIEVQDPNMSPLITRTLQTDLNGKYSLNFTLPEGSPYGEYWIFVSSTYSNETVINSTTFNLNMFILTVETDKKLYRLRENVQISGKAIFNDRFLPYVLVAVEVQDPDGSTVLVRAVTTNESGVYYVDFKLSSEAKLGNYTVYASAAYNEAKITNSTFFQVSKALTTDINGDGIVNILDIAVVAMAFGSEVGDERWNPAADIDGNGVVNIIDVARVAMDYGKTVE